VRVFAWDRFMRPHSPKYPIISYECIVVGRNLEQINFRKYLLPFSPQSLVYPLFILKYKEKITLNFDFASFVIYEWTLVSYTRKERGRGCSRLLCWRIYLGSKREEIRGDWQKLDNSDLHNLPSSPNIIWVFESCRLNWSKNVARMGEDRNADHLEDLGVDGT
jgi:hypothetical protein